MKIGSSKKRTKGTKGSSWVEVDKQIIGGAEWSLDIAAYEERRWRPHSESVSFEEENKKSSRNIFRGEV